MSLSWRNCQHYLKQYFSNLNKHQSHLEGSLEQMAGSHPRVSDVAGRGWGLVVCIFNKVQVLLLVQGLYSENHRCKRPSVNSSPWHVRPCTPQPPITLLPSSFTTSCLNPCGPILPTRVTLPFTPVLCSLLETLSPP